MRPPQAAASLLDLRANPEQRLASLGRRGRPISDDLKRLVGVELYRWCRQRRATDFLERLVRVELGWLIRPV